MNITSIPFNKYIQIQQPGENENVLQLEFTNNLENHLGTFHASAQFGLAEATSGLALQNMFPDLANSVIPVLRKTETKYRKPATTTISAKASINETKVNKFTERFNAKGRCSISVDVEVKDQEGSITMTGVFEWYVQKL